MGPWGREIRRRIAAGQQLADALSNPRCPIDGATFDEHFDEGGRAERDDAIERVRAIPRRSGTPEWSKGAAVAQAAGFDMGLAYAQDAIADTPGPRRGDITGGH